MKTNSIISYISRILLALIVIVPLNGMAKGRTFQESSMLSSMGKNDKLAVLMVYFGTTHADTRALTIDALNNRAKTLFDSIAVANRLNIDVKQAWTSRIICKKISEASGEIILNPSQMLAALKKEGYTHILIQASNIIEGDEMSELRRECAAFSNDFKEIRIGDPLLYSVEDVNTVAEIIGNDYAAKIGPSRKCAACGKCKNSQKGSVALFVGHGTYTPATATYSMLEYILHVRFFNNAFVGTIEGHPSIYDAKCKINAYYNKTLNLKKMSAKKSNASEAAKRDTIVQKSVTIVPFMFVAGEHVVNDISVDIKQNFENDGYSVDIIHKGLGELSSIRDLFIKHALFALNNREITLIEKKVKYMK